MSLANVGSNGIFSSLSRSSFQVIESRGLEVRERLSVLRDDELLAALHSAQHLFRMLAQLLLRQLGHSQQSTHGCHLSGSVR
jgi:hypothetical protein